jgi:hypothetical protein
VEESTTTHPKGAVDDMRARDVGTPSTLETFAPHSSKEAKKKRENGALERLTN